MAAEPGKNTSPGAALPTPRQIPLADISDLPGAVNIRTYTPKDLGGLVSSIQSVGVREPIIVRRSEDGKYQLLAGQRRRKASELAKKTSIPALVYEMTLQEALAYHKAQMFDPKAAVPGKPFNPETAEKPKTEDKQPAAPAPADKGKDAEKPAPAAAPVTAEKPKTEDKQPAAPAPTEKPKDAEKPAPAAASAAAEKTKAEDKQPAAPAPADKAKAAEKPTPTAASAAAEKAKAEDKQPAAPAPADKAKDAEKPAPAAAPSTAEKPKAEDKQPAAPAPTDKAKDAEKTAPTAAPAATEKPKEETGKDEKSTEKKQEAKPAAAPAGPAAVGPAGTAITQVFDARLAPPSEKDLKDLPVPKEGESYFITLHPAYLERSKFNNFSVNRDSDNFKELRKAVELAGIKDPVLARPKEGGGLEILSGQRRHLIGTELNYPIPTIIQRIDDADAKILVADSNLHRDKISTYDLSRALKMKMEGMKQKAGRKKKGDVGERLNTDEAIAREMGITVSKFNRMLRMSEATKDVCDKVDDGTLALSIASALSFLKPENQSMASRLSDLGYKLSTERVEYLKRVEKANKLDESAMRKVLNGENILDPPKAVPMPAKQESAAPAPAPTAAPSASPTIPPSPDVAAPPAHVMPSTPAPTAATAAASPAATPSAEVPEEPDDPFKGRQERAESAKVILTGDRLRKYYPDVSMTPREIEEDIYSKLERCRQMDEKQKAKAELLKGPKSPTR